MQHNHLDGIISFSHDSHFSLSCLFLKLISSARLLKRFCNEITINRALSIIYNLEDMDFVISSEKVLCFQFSIKFSFKLFCFELHMLFVAPLHLPVY